MRSLREHLELSLSDLVDFGNYLLSDERKETFDSEESSKSVWDNDIANYEEKTGKKLRENGEKEL